MISLVKFLSVSAISRYTNVYECIYQHLNRPYVLGLMNK